MKTLFPLFPKTSFFFLKKEFDKSLPFFVFPGIWLEIQKQGVSVITRKITLGFLNFRIHLFIGKIIYPSKLPINHPDLGLDNLINWASKTFKNEWPDNITKNDFYDWLQSSQWNEIVKWYGANYHYGKILIIRDFLKQKNKNQSLNIDLDIKLSNKGKS